MGNIETRLFRYFVTLGEELNFARASERLGITPPTLTHQIQKLERQLDARLLTRKTKAKVQLTQAGERFLESARDVIHRAQQAESAARQAARGEIGRLEIGYTIATAYSGVIQRVLSGFQQKHPGIDLTLHQRSTTAQMRAIVATELDVGFARVPKQYPTGLSGFPVHRSSVILAIPRTHPFARRRGPIAPRALREETFVSTSIEFDLAFKRHVESLASVGGFTAKVGKRADDLTTVLTYVSAGYGIAVVSREMIKFRDPNVVFKEIDSPNVPEVTYSFMFRTGESAPACKAFIAALRVHAMNGTGLVA